VPRRAPSEILTRHAKGLIALAERLEHTEADRRVFTPDQLDQVVEHRLERLRASWKAERRDLRDTIAELRQQVAELEDELAAFRNRDLGPSTPLRSEAAD
jgi:DNA gyrase/topoisomerase IV subunit A